MRTSLPPRQRRGRSASCAPESVTGCGPSRMGEWVMGSTKCLGMIAVTASIACSASTPSTDRNRAVPLTVTADVDGQADGSQGPACQPPAGANTFSDASLVGCFPVPTGKFCIVSNGSHVSADGSVTNGTENCQATCDSSHYELECLNAISVPPPPGPLPAPDSSLNCVPTQGLTPANSNYYCCPCAP
jgi:hypothetical protein